MEGLDGTLKEIIAFQVEIAEYLIKKWKLEPEQYTTLVEKYNLMEFIEENYYILHLSGIKGIEIEIKEYIQRRGN